VRAGPGQSPDKPQPKPNKTAPKTSFESSFVFFEREKSEASNGVPFLIKLKVTRLIKRAVPSANNKVGSHCEEIVKKPRTLEILHKPEISKPAPKINPNTKVNR